MSSTPTDSQEFLYGPFTYLKPTGLHEEIQVGPLAESGGRSMLVTVIEVKPYMT